ncbi:MAG: GNAT family N-acetyltransferase [Ignavibacteriae bacterium]|nr:GNAT family N-acetyltransferase [Ignavibacteriota bacterium]
MILENLIELRQKFQAGKSTLSNEEINELITKLIDFINDFQNDLFINFENVSELSQLFTSIDEGDFVKVFVSKFDEKSFYKFGEKLFESLNTNNEPTKSIIENILYTFLNFIRNSEFLRKIFDDKNWTNLISKIVEETNFNTRKLFQQRTNQYGKKVLFKVIKGDKVQDYTWNETNKIIGSYSQSLSVLLSEHIEKPRVAFLLENSLTMALLDLACLNSGIINVMIPANSVSQHILYILNQTKCDVILIANDKQLAKLKSIKKDLPYLKKGVLIDGTSAEDWVISFNEFLNLHPKENNELVFNDLQNTDTATLMYTSGTTGEPKGIIFSQKNIVFKRFCRAIALPEISDSDLFLAYLPLYHTFGRWLELVGSIFWGATYAFMENPSAETMIANMNLVHPSVFISIPKKWIQLYEFISSKVDVEADSDENISNEVRNITGGNLKWGLSAAGYLPSEVFQFFQKNNIQLMSGFGMTEATGGITMTPPGKYIPNSLGKALPGIEIKLGDDGELLVKGDYVMPGYFDQTKEETFIDGWFPTGDIMKMDSNGFIEIIDRKKEIYKNIKGETIAPQRIENLFRDFEIVKQVFVVGDHRPFNTVLIHPDFENQIFINMNENQKNEYFSNLIVTINKFLAPFERIVDFKVIENPFTLESGELTPKGTFKRRVIEENYKSLIDQLYKKDFYSLYLENIEIKIPNWFLRERGCLSGDLKVENGFLSIPKLDRKVTIQKNDKNNFRIGNFNFRISKPFIDLHEFLINPIYWIGNDEFVKFTDDTILQWYRQNIEDENIQFTGNNFAEFDYSESYLQLNKIHQAGEKSLYGLHLAIHLIQSDNFDNGNSSIEYLNSLFKDEHQEIFKIALYFLDKPSLVKNFEVRKQLFLLAIKHTKQNNIKKIFEIYLKDGQALFDENIIENIVSSKKILDSLDLLDEILNEYVQLKFKIENLNETIISTLLKILSQTGIKHPTRYEEMRRKLVKIQLIEDWPELSKLAQDYRTKMRDGFRKWLGINETVAVDSETGEEYGWDEVLIFEEDLNDDEKLLLNKVISTTQIIKEAVFLFSKGVLISLNNILPRGIWISKIRDEEQLMLYRISIQTRLQGSFDIIFHQNKNRNVAEIKSEVNWLILAGSRFFVTELVEDFGGYWDEYNVWTQKYQPGLNVENLFARDVKKDEQNAMEKYYYIWPFFIWNATAAYINFWRLTSGNLQLTNPTPDKLIIPSHDYQLGTRFTSLSDRSQFTDFSNLFFNFYNKFVVPIETKYPWVKKDSSWKYIFPGLINAEGEYEGVEILSLFLLELKNDTEKNHEIVFQLEKFLASIKKNGYIPKQLYFAVKRFGRWNNLNTEASFEAQAQMLNELYDTYNLVGLEKKHPETRTRFFLHTVFKESNEDFKNLIRELCLFQHDGKITKDEFLRELSRIQSEFELSDKEIYFLTRLSYPHLKPTDSASFLHLATEGDHAANLVVQVDDHEGNPFYIRKPITPKEISKLYQLFIDGNMQVSFKPEHKFLVAISDRGFIIGGMFYNQFEEEVVHMEKIVVSNRFRRKGVSEALMNEFFNRMKDEGFAYVTTGFFRPEYFYKFDFKIEKKYSGLVKKLSENLKK